MGVMKEFKLENDEVLRVKKIGNFYFAYARDEGSYNRSERYLGRCNPDGSPIRSLKTRSINKKR